MNDAKIRNSNFNHRDKTGHVRNTIFYPIFFLLGLFLSSNALTADTSSDTYRRDIEALKTRAEQGDPNAQFSLGLCYIDGEDIPLDETEAVRWFRKAAEQDYVEAQCSLGLCYGNGVGVPEDKKEAVNWFRKAAERGDVVAQCMLGFCYGNGVGVSKDEAEAAKWYHKAAEQENTAAQCTLGFFYEYGIGVPEDKAEAVKWYRKAAEQGNPQAQFALDNPGAFLADLNPEKLKAEAEKGDANAQFMLSERYFFGRGVAEDHSEAFKWCRKAAQQNHVKAQRLLSLMYYEGKGTEKDWGEAENWLLKAAKQGDAESQLAFAKEFCCLFLIYTPEGFDWLRKAADQEYVPAQYELADAYRKSLFRQLSEPDENISREECNRLKNEAIKYYLKAAEKEHAESQYVLAMVYYTGDFCYFDIHSHATEKLAAFTKDAKEAEKWLNKAADNGHVEAMFSFGEICYENGRNQEAVKWYKTAAEKNHPGAMYKLGRCYELGDGVSSDQSEAVKWYQGAAEGGLPEAKEALKRLGVDTMDAAST